MKNILYLSYDGILEPLGQSQVLAYLEKLNRYDDTNIYLYSFEKYEDLQDKEKLKQFEKRIQKSSIVWIRSRYHKNPFFLSTILDILTCLFKSIFLVIRYKINLVHARSYVPALVALVIKKILNSKFLFDMRGFWADERVDGGLWSKDSKIFKITKILEKKFFLEADHVISLTNAGIEEMRKFEYLKIYFPKYTVIPTCADLDKFFPREKEDNKNFTVGYLGTAGTWYLFEETIKAFNLFLAKDPTTRFLIINKGEHDYINDCLEKNDIPKENVTLVYSSFDEIPKLISKMDVSIFFIKPLFSKQSSSPTKLGELLGCGVPCLSNAGVGDMSEILHSNNVGITVSDFTDDTLNLSIDRLINFSKDPHIGERCVETAKRFFSLESGVKNYRSVYNTLINNG